MFESYNNWNFYERRSKFMRSAIIPITKYALIFFYYYYNSITFVIKQLEMTLNCLLKAPSYMSLLQKQITIKLTDHSKVVEKIRKPD